MFKNPDFGSLFLTFNIIIIIIIFIYFFGGEGGLLLFEGHTADQLLLLSIFPLKIKYIHKTLK